VVQLKKAVFITNIPAHYRVAMLNRAFDILSDNDVELQVIFSRSTYKRRDYWEISEESFRFRYYYLDKNSSISLGRKKLLELGFGIGKILKDIKPDVLIISGFSLLSLIASKFARKNGIPFILYSGETEYNSRHFKLLKVRKIIRQYLIQRASYFITYGILAEEYIRSYRKTARISIAINSIDTDIFIKKIEKSRQIAPRKDKVRILFLGNITKGKGVEFLLNIAGYFKDEAEFIVAGGGDELTKCETYIKEKSINNVTLKGPVKYDDVISYYLDADIFILPSTIEAYGLVLVEAACCGLPLLGSKFAGASYEIIQNDVNGFIIDPYDTDDLIKKVKHLIDSRELRENFGVKSKEFINMRVNISNSGKGFAEGIINCLNA